MLMVVEEMWSDQVGRTLMMVEVLVLESVAISSKVKPCMYSQNF